MGEVGAGYIGNNGVLLVDTPDEAEPVAEALRKQDLALGDKRVLGVVRTLVSVLPKQQEASSASRWPRFAKRLIATVTS